MEKNCQFWWQWKTVSFTEKNYNFVKKGVFFSQFHFVIFTEINRNIFNRNIL